MTTTATRRSTSATWSTSALTYDHRLIDGGDAARFLNTVKARLETADFSQELAGTTAHAAAAASRLAARSMAST